MRGEEEVPPAEGRSGVLIRGGQTLEDALDDAHDGRYPTQSPEY